MLSDILEKFYGKKGWGLPGKRYNTTKFKIGLKDSQNLVSKTAKIFQMLSSFKKYKYILYIIRAA